jgi:hypothetical protein
MKKIIVKELNGDNVFLVNFEDVEKKVCFGDVNDEFVTDRELTELELKELNSKLVDFDFDIYDCLEDSAETTKIEFRYVKCYESLEEQNILYLNSENKLEQCNINFLDTINTYTYWDGNNHITIELEDIDENEVFEELEVEKILLDTFDGNNHNYKTKHNHGRLYKVNENWFLEEITDFTGDLGTIEEIDNIENWLEAECDILDDDVVRAIKKEI